MTSSMSLEWLLKQIQLIPGPKKQRKKWIDVICPFHNDSKPSLGINIEGGSRRLGDIHCWSCPARGNWDKLANRLGLQTLASADIEAFPIMPASVYESEWAIANNRLVNGAYTSSGRYTDLSDDQPSRSSTAGQVAGILTEEKLWLEHKLKLVIDWAPSNRWRTISGSLLHKLGARAGLRYGEKQIWLPVTIDDELVGSWIGRLSKSEDPKISSYLNSSGTWISNYGLWPYDYVALMVKRHKKVLLVEGQRDALRLIDSGIPALCVFGTNSVTVEKLAYVLALEASVYLCGDGDRAGREFNSQVKKMLKNLGEKATIIELPDGVDPAKLTKDQLDDLRRSLGIKKPAV